MRSTILFATAILTLGVIVPGSASAPTTSEPNTYVLALSVGDSVEPVSADVTLLPAESGGQLTLTLPGDDPATTSYILVDPDEIKFQVPRMSTDRIATIQFVGTGDYEAGFSGRFWGFVDGAARPDMSGSFTLTQKEEPRPSEN